MFINLHSYMSFFLPKWQLYKNNFFKILFLEREGEKHQCVVASCAPPAADLTYNPGMCPGWESNLQPFGSQAGTQSTEPHQPGPIIQNFSARKIRSKHRNSAVLSSPNLNSSDNHHGVHPLFCCCCRGIGYKFIQWTLIDYQASFKSWLCHLTPVGP